MTRPANPKGLSKTLAYVLRHRPDSIGIHLDPGGWVDVSVLVDALVRAGHDVDRGAIEHVVATSDKRRYELVGDRLRAAQGHSITVDLGLAPAVPPDVLFHGTVERFLASIVEQGLLPRSRQHVHLSADVATATEVGNRRGKPIVLTVAAGRMRADGWPFRVAANGVWLVSSVPPAYLTIPDRSR